MREARYAVYSCHTKVVPARYTGYTPYADYAVAASLPPLRFAVSIPRFFFHFHSLCATLTRERDSSVAADTSCHAPLIPMPLDYAFHY